MKKIKKVIVFIVSLLIISISLKLKNAGILALLQISFTSVTFIKFIEHILDAFDFTTWLLFITISMPFNVKKTSIVLTLFFGILSIIGIFINFMKFEPEILFSSIFLIIALIFFHRIANNFNFIKKIKSDFIIDMDIDKLIWQTAFYTFIFSIVFTISIAASIYSLSMLIKAPIWTILVILPLAELLVWEIIIRVFQSVGNYLINIFNVHPAVVRSLFITSVISTIIIVLFLFSILPGPFSSDTSFFRGMANVAIMVFAMRVFTVSIFQFQNHISRSFQTAYSKNLHEFSFDDVKYNIDEVSISKI